MTADARVRSDGLTLGVLYLAQFVQIGVVSSVLPVTLRQSGSTLTELAWVELLLILPLLKVFWAPLTDRYGVARWGHYRSWVLVLQPLRLLCWLPLAWLAPHGVTAPLVVTLCACAILSSTVDTAVDAWAFRSAARFGLTGVNALQVGAGMVGTLAGAGGGLVLLHSAGLGAALALVTVTLTASIVLVLGHRSELDGGPEAVSLSGAYRASLTVLASPTARSWVWLQLPLYAVALGSVQALLLPFLVDQGFRADWIGYLLGTAGAAAGLVGVAVVVALRWLGRTAETYLAPAGALLALGTAILAAALGLGWEPLVIGAVLLFRTCSGAWSVLSNATTMGLCRRGSAATDYAVITSWFFAVSFAGGALWLWIADLSGYAWAFAGAVVVSAAAALASLTTGPRGDGKVAAPEGAGRPTPAGRGGPRPTATH